MPRPSSTSHGPELPGFDAEVTIVLLSAYDHPGLRWQYEVLFQKEYTSQEEVNKQACWIVPPRERMTKKDTYTSGEIAKILDIPDRTARAYLSIGKIQGTQNPITGRWKVTKETLLDFMKQYEMTPNNVGYPPLKPTSS
jgi:hypothetical protein